jgi:hypothetical protein
MAASGFAAGSAAAQQSQTRLPAFIPTEYAPAKLNFPAFARQGGAESFDGFDLRTFQNYRGVSWDYRFIGLRDQFSRDTQLAQGQPGKRGDFYHLPSMANTGAVHRRALGGLYGESYFGGRKEDYDVVKVETSAGYTLLATDGNLEAWRRLWQAATNGFATDAAYFKVQGLNVDGTRNPAYENLLDVDNLIDYMLVIFFTGNIDAPVSQFLGNNSPNNMYAVRNRTGLYGGFRFFAHDSEHTLLHASSLGNTNELQRDRTALPGRRPGPAKRRHRPVQEQSTLHFHALDGERRVPHAVRRSCAEAILQRRRPDDRGLSPAFRRAAMKSTARSWRNPRAGAIPSGQHPSRATSSG